MEEEGGGGGLVGLKLVITFIVIFSAQTLEPINYNIA